MSLILLSAGLAYAQRPDYSPQYGGRYRLEGTYESSVLGGRIQRTLRLDRDGRVEIVTEVSRRAGDTGFNRDWDDRNDRGQDNRQYLGRYGRTAVEAARGRAVRHTGRWIQRDDRIVLRMDDLRFQGGYGSWNGGNGRAQQYDRSPGAYRPDDRRDLRLVRRADGFVLSGDLELYGRDDVFFRRDSGRSNDWPRQDDRLGTVRYGDERLAIDRIDLLERSGNDARLVVRAGSRTLEFRGDADRRGNEVVFRVRNGDRDRGTFTLTMRGDRVVSIRGTGEENGRRVSFEDGYDRRDVW